MTVNRHIKVIRYILSIRFIIVTGCITVISYIIVILYMIVVGWKIMSSKCTFMYIHHPLTSDQEYMTHHNRNNNNKENNFSERDDKLHKFQSPVSLMVRKVYKRKTIYTWRWLERENYKRPNNISWWKEMNWNKVWKNGITRKNGSYGRSSLS